MKLISIWLTFCYCIMICSTQDVKAHSLLEIFDIDRQLANLLVKSLSEQCADSDCTLCAL